ncbi:MAG: hypothetical protein KDI65_04725 [Alphaproteobacteria bacterium]|nr:hypothetical protein [Alphaproteobacteria bacterium]
MFSIEGNKPSAEILLQYIEQFEEFCRGSMNMTPQFFRDINNELSVGAVMFIGKRRYKVTDNSTHLIWQGVDQREHDLGPVHNANIFRDYPGFHKARTHALGSEMVVSDSIEKVRGRRGTYTIVTLKDGTTGVGPNYNLALRNAALRMVLKSAFNRASLFTYWTRLWGNA